MSIFDVFIIIMVFALIIEGIVSVKKEKQEILSKGIWRYIFKDLKAFWIVVILYIVYNAIKSDDIMTFAKNVLMYLLFCVALLFAKFIFIKLGLYLLKDKTKISEKE